ncbi:MAG: LysE family translocator, partial [Roseovarius sp.]
MIETAIALLVFLFPLAYSPGPGNLFFAANGARFGLRATLSANFGYHVATWLVTAAIGFGFLAVIERVPALFTILKVGGSLYVLWIAWKMLRAGVLGGTSAPRPAGFRDGVVLLVLNPKAYVLIGLIFAQFLGPSGLGTVATVLLITTVFTLNNLVAFLLWTLAGDRLAACFRTPRSARMLNTGFGALL